MSWYTTTLFPKLLQTIEGGQVKKAQSHVTHDARGKVLELGFGAGNSLDWYGPAVTEVTAIEPNAGFRALAAPRLAEAPLPVTLLDARGESLPLPDATFDTALVLLTLCSVQDVDAVLSELRRCLRPGGRLLFLEHVASEHTTTRRLQGALEPLWRRVGAGCHLTRDPVAAAAQAGFKDLESAPVDIPGVPGLLPFVRLSARAPGPDAQ